MILPNAPTLASLSVLSTLTRFNSAGRITRIFMPASIGPRSICSAPASPRRLRQRVMLEGSIGIRMLKMPHAAEVLPVRIFHPQGNHVFIAQVMPILQIVQSHHQTRRDVGRTMTGMIGAAQGLFERLPVDRKTETNQGMAPVDQLLPIYLKQLPLWLLRLALGLHYVSPVSKTFAAATSEESKEYLLGLCCHHPLDSSLRGVYPRAKRRVQNDNSLAPPLLTINGRSTKPFNASVRGPDNSAARPPAIQLLRVALTPRD